MTYTVEEVRTKATLCAMNLSVQDMLDAYADLLEQIQRAKAGVVAYLSQSSLDHFSESLKHGSGYAQFAVALASNMPSDDKSIPLCIAVAHLLPRGEAQDEASATAWTLAEKVRVALDKQSCPDVFMRIAVESITANFDRAWVDHVARLNTIIDRQRREIAVYEAVANGSDGVWFYQGDGQDFAESLSCLVVMRADQFRNLLGAQPRVPDGYTAVLSDGKRYWGDKPAKFGDWRPFWIAAAPQPKEAK